MTCGYISALQLVSTSAFQQVILSADVGSHEHFLGVEPGLADLLPLAPGMTVIPAKAGIHCSWGGRAGRLVDFRATLSGRKAVHKGIDLPRTAHSSTGDGLSAKTIS